MAVLTVAIAMTFVGFGFMTPFMPLYLQQVGVTEPEQVRAWSGGIAAAASISFAISAPFWGLLADRLGRKPMVIRAMWGSGIALIALSFVRDPALLLTIRVIQGLFSGPVTASLALTSTTVPDRHLTRAIGAIQAAMLIGGSLGPMIGGVAADAVGIPSTILVGGVLNICAGFLVLAFCREQFVRPHPSGPVRRHRIREGIAILSPALFALAAMQIALQFSSNGVIAVFALYVQELGRDVSASTFTGLIQGLYSAAAIVGVLLAARVSTSFGYKAPLVAGALVAAILFMPQALAPNLLILGLSRGVQGIFVGLLSPLISTLVSVVTPVERRATVYGAISGSSGLGAAAGPLSAGFVSAWLGLASVFWMTAGVLIVAALIATRVRGFSRATSFEKS